MNVTDVSYPSEDGYNVYSVPVSLYYVGISEEEAATHSTRPVRHEDAPGFRGVETAPAPASEYAHATPGRVMSTLAYVLLSRQAWPVSVHTARNYGRSRDVEAATDPGDEVFTNSFYRPVSDWHGLSTTPNGNWKLTAEYLDDRIRTDYLVENYPIGPGTRGPGELYDEYFLETESEYGAHITAWGDYVGSTVTRSNHRSLLRDYPGVFVTTVGGHSSTALVIPLFVPAEATDVFQTVRTAGYEYPLHPAHYEREAAEDLADILIGLAESYPVYDDEDHSALQEELTQEKVEGEWFHSELLDQLSEAICTRVLRRIDGYTLGDNGIIASFGDNGTATQTWAEADARYDFVQAVRTMLSETTTMLSPSNPTSTGACHTVTSLFRELSEENYGPTFEGATTDHVVYTNAEETIERMALFLTGEDL